MRWAEKRLPAELVERAARCDDSRKYPRAMGSIHIAGAIFEQDTGKNDFEYDFVGYADEVSSFVKKGVTGERLTQNSSPFGVIIAGAFGNGPTIGTPAVIWPDTV